MSCEDTPDVLCACARHISYADWPYQSCVSMQVLYNLHVGSVDPDLIRSESRVSIMCVCVQAGGGE